MAYPASIMTGFICPTEPSSRYKCDMMRYATDQVGCCPFAHSEEGHFDGRKREDKQNARKWAREPIRVLRRVDPQAVHHLMAHGKAQLSPVICLRLLHGRCHREVRTRLDGFAFCGFDRWHPTMDDLAALSRANMHGSGLDGHQDFAAAAAAVAIPPFEDPTEDATDGTGGATSQDTESGHNADHSPVDNANRNCLRRGFEALAEHFDNRPGETVFLVAFALVILVMTVGGLGFFVQDRIRLYRASRQ